MKLIKFPVRETNLNVLECEWFTGNATIGIILCEDNYSRVTSVYVGLSTSTDLRESAETIVRTGTKLPKGIAESLFGPQPFFKN